MPELEALVVRLLAKETSPCDMAVLRASGKGQVIQLGDHLNSNYRNEKEKERKQRFDSKHNNPTFSVFFPIGALR